MMQASHTGHCDRFMRSVCVVTLLFSLGAGCVSTRPVAVAGGNHLILRHRAEALLEHALGYPHNPVVRVESVEALQEAGSDRALPWIREALLDDHPAVRFAACVAVGTLRDHLASSQIKRLLSDEDASVRVAALYARHRLGFTQQTGLIAYYLLEHQEPAVRRNAALVLGLLGERGAIKVLAKAMRDHDEGVRHHALEAMARLGQPDAAKELAFLTNAGIGSQEVFAILALSGTNDPRHVDTFRYKLTTAIHLETKLAAARALGDRGYEDGFDIAARALRQQRATINDPDDPPAGQVLRVRQMAAGALGAIGRLEALPWLARVMEDTADPRLQVSAAGAMLRILAKHRARPLPFLREGYQGGG